MFCASTVHRRNRHLQMSIVRQVRPAATGPLLRRVFSRETPSSPSGARVGAYHGVGALGTTDEVPQFSCCARSLWAAREPSAGSVGDGSRRHRGRELEIPWGRLATTPRPPLGNSVETSRGATAAASWTFRGDGSRRRRGCRLDIPRRRDAAVATWIFRGDGSRRHRGRELDIPRRRLATTPRLVGPASNCRQSFDEMFRNRRFLEGAATFGCLHRSGATT